MVQLKVWVRLPLALLFSLFLILMDKVQIGESFEKYFHPNESEYFHESFFIGFLGGNTR